MTNFVSLSYTQTTSFMRSAARTIRDTDGLSDAECRAALGALVVAATNLYFGRPATADFGAGLVDFLRECQLIPAAPADEARDHLRVAV